MKTSKKLICFLCCLVVIFSCASVSWAPDVDAAMPVASYVASVVGSFILSAGFSFDNRGDFQSATEAFLESDVARGITEITTHIGNICALGNLSEPLLIHSLIKSDFFKDFWDSIYEFFGRGDITVDLGGIPAPPDGYAYYNEHLLPFLTKTNLKDFILYKYADNTYYHYCFSKVTYSTSPWLKTITYYPYYSLIQFNGSYTLYTYTSGDTNWVYNTSKSNVSGGSSVNYGDVFNTEAECELVWSNFNMHHGEKYDVDTSNIVWFKSEPIIEGTENVDVIGVYNNEVYTPTDIINSWERVAENGGTIDWALDSIPAYGDITSGDKDAPVTQTQSGVLTQSGVKVQTDEEVKEEVKQEAIKELENYTVTGLASIFPFCIPFDIYNFFAVLTAEREAPVFDFPLNFGKLGSHNIHVDLSGWDTVAQILRTIELLAFCVALAWGTSKLIKW